MKALLKALTEAPGPSGYEDAVRKLILKEVRPLADEVHVDVLGNVIVRRRPAKSARAPKKIMLSAHMDEIGLIASHIDARGFVRFAAVGAHASHSLLGARIRFLNGTPGIVGCDAPEDSNESPASDKMCIDVGARDRQSCAVRVGDVAALEGIFTELGTRLVGKSMDDRAGVAVLIETLRSLRLAANDVYFVFSAHSAVGERGAATAAFGIGPDLGLAVDVTPSGDAPASTKHAVELGKGVCVKFRDEGMIADRAVVEWLLAAARKARISHQREVRLDGSTEARAIQSIRGGVPAGALSIPARYLHSASEMVDYSDLQSAVQLLKFVLTQPVKLRQ